MLRCIFAGGPAAGHTDTQCLQAQCVATDPVGVGTSGAQSTACIYGYARLAYRHGETDHRLLIDYYKMNIDYEKKLSLTSLICAYGSWRRLVLARHNCRRHAPHHCRAISPSDSKSSTCLHGILQSARQPHGLLRRIHNMSEMPRSSKKRSETGPVVRSSVGPDRSRTGNWASSNFRCDKVNLFVACGNVLCLNNKSDCEFCL